MGVDKEEEINTPTGLSKTVLPPHLDYELVPGKPCSKSGTAVPAPLEDVWVCLALGPLTKLRESRGCLLSLMDSEGLCFLNKWYLKFLNITFMIYFLIHLFIKIMNDCLKGRPLLNTLKMTIRMRVTHILTPHRDRGHLLSPCRPLVTLFYYQLLVNQPHSWFFHFTSNSGMVIPLTYFLSASSGWALS